MTDAQLLEASRRGERAAFGRLVERYQSLVCAVSFSATGDRVLSEDVAQETFLTAWSRLDQLREPGNLRSWLCAIARNLGRKALRHCGREAPAAETPEPVGLQASPFDAAALAESERIVWEALRHVPEIYREALVLYYRENRSAREVAAALGISENAALQRLSRGRRHLSESVSAMVEQSLERTRPGRGFSAGVVAALPASTALPHAPASAHGNTARTVTQTQGGSMFKIALVSGALVAVAGGAFVYGTWADSDGPHTNTVTAAAANDEPDPAETSGEVRGGVPGAARVRAARPQLANASAAQPAMQISAEDIGRLGLHRGPARGPADAPVEIVVFTDFGCSMSGKVLGTLDELWDEYPSLLRLVVKQFPILPGSKLAAQAALAAQDQGKFWELHDLMLAHQSDLSKDDLLGYAGRAGLDVERLRRDLEEGRFASAVKNDMAAAEEIGVRGTPYFLVNDQLVAGARPIGEFHGLIRQELERVAPGRVPAVLPHQHPVVPENPGACDCEDGSEDCREVEVVQDVVVGAGCEGAPPDCGGSSHECSDPP